MKEVYEFLKKCGTYYLATIENNEARVRPFGTIDIYNGALTIQTGKIKAVSKQMHQNPNIEICAFDGQKWLRLSAKAIEVEDLSAQEHMLNEYPSLKGMYQVNDGNNEIFKLTHVKAVFSGFGIESKTINWD